MFHLTYTMMHGNTKLKLVQQVWFEYILGIQTLQPIHCSFPAYQARMYCHVSFKFHSENLQCGIPTVDEEKWFTSSVYAVVYFEKFRADMLMQYPDVCVYVCIFVVYFSLV